MVNATAKEISPKTEQENRVDFFRDAYPSEVWPQHFGAPSMALACALPTHSSPPHQIKRGHHLGVAQQVHELETRAAVQRRSQPEHKGLAVGKGRAPSPQGVGVGPVPGLTASCLWTQRRGAAQHVHELESHHKGCTPSRAAHRATDWGLWQTRDRHPALGMRSLRVHPLEEQAQLPSSARGRITPIKSTRESYEPSPEAP